MVYQLLDGADDVFFSAFPLTIHEFQTEYKPNFKYFQVFPVFLVCLVPPVELAPLASPEAQGGLDRLVHLEEMEHLDSLDLQDGLDLKVL